MSVLPAVLALLVLGAVCLTGWLGLRRLTELRFAGASLALAAAATQAASVLLQQGRLPLLAASTALLLLFCWRNRRHPGMALIALGIGLNAAVMLANGGAMPLAPESRAVLGWSLPEGADLPLNKARVLSDAAAPLAWLGDRWHLPGALAGLAAWSIGDGLLIGGVGWLLLATMKGLHRDRPEIRATSAPLPRA